MESNHRFLRVKQVSSPLDHRTEEHVPKDLNPICELQRLTSRLRAGESVPNKRVSCGNRTHLTGLEARRLCRSAKDTDDVGSLKGEM